MSYSIDQLTESTLKSICDTFFFECILDGEGDCVVRDALVVVVAASPKQRLLQFLSMFRVRGTRPQVLEFCNRFNSSLVLVRAQVRSSNESDGASMVMFDYDLAIGGEDSVEPRDIVQLLRRFMEVIRGGNNAYDEYNLF